MIGTVVLVAWPWNSCKRRSAETIMPTLSWRGISLMLGEHVNGAPRWTLARHLPRIRAGERSEERWEDESSGGSVCRKLMSRRASNLSRHERGTISGCARRDEGATGSDRITLDAATSCGEGLGLERVLTKETSKVIGVVSRARRCGDCSISSERRGQPNAL